MIFNNETSSRLQFEESHERSYEIYSYKGINNFCILSLIVFVQDYTEDTINGYNNDSLLRDEQEFLSTLYNFMKKQNTPIERIPSLGFKTSELICKYYSVNHCG